MVISRQPHMGLKSIAHNLEQDLADMFLFDVPRNFFVTFDSIVFVPHLLLKLLCIEITTGEHNTMVTRKIKQLMFCFQIVKLDMFLAALLTTPNYFADAQVCFVCFDPTVQKPIVLHFLPRQ